MGEFSWGSLSQKSRSRNQVHLIFNLNLKINCSSYLIMSANSTLLLSTFCTGTDPSISISVTAASGAGNIQFLVSILNPTESQPEHSKLPLQDCSLWSRLFLNRHKVLIFCCTLIDFHKWLMSFWGIRKLDWLGQPKSQLHLWCLLKSLTPQTRGDAFPSMEGQCSCSSAYCTSGWVISLNKYSVISVVHFNNVKELWGRSCKYLLTFQYLNLFATSYPDSYHPWQLTFPSKKGANAPEPFL